LTANAARRDALLSVRAVLAGRSRVEITAEEAVLAIHWASRVPGWPERGGFKRSSSHPGLPLED
jgi:hypothetical protein